MAPGILPDISLGSISDKSKADSLAKTLALAQASWLILDTISRWAQSLTVTTLELNTVAHALCALLVFYIWWHKPLDVTEPTRITAEAIHPLVAFAWIFSDRDRVHGVYGKQRAEACEVAWFDQPLSSASGGASAGHTSSGTIFRIDFRIAGLDLDGVQLRRFLDQTKLEPKMPFYVLPGGRAIGKLQRTNATHLAAADPQLHRRWTMAWQFQQRYPAAFSGYPLAYGADAFVPYSTTVLEYRSGLGFTDRRVVMLAIDRSVKTWARVLFEGQWASESLGNLRHFYEYVDVDLSPYLALCLSALAYGGLHGAAWRDSFPTPTEHFLWRISSVYMAASGVVLTALWMCIWRDDMKARSSRTTSGLAERKASSSGTTSALAERIRGLILLALVLFLLGYLFARVFLVVEAFIALRALPSPAYRTSDWMQYLALF